MTVLLVSHVLSELEDLVDDVIFLLEGRVEFQGSLRRLEGDHRREPAGAGRRPTDAAEGLMTAMTVFRYELQDLRRSRWVMGYTLCLLLLTEALLRFGGGGPRAVLSLMNVVLGVVPLVAIVFGTCTSTARGASSSSCWPSRWAGASSSPASTPDWPCRWRRGSSSGSGLPFLWDGGGDGSLAGPLAMLLGAGTLLTLVFTALAMLVSLLVNDRAKGLGLAILLWLVVTALYDALIVLVATTLSRLPARAAADRSHPPQPDRSRDGWRCSSGWTRPR